MKEDKKVNISNFDDVFRENVNFTRNNYFVIDENPISGFEPYFYRKYPGEYSVFVKLGEDDTVSAKFYFYPEAKKEDRVYCTNLRSYLSEYDVINAIKKGWAIILCTKGDKLAVLSLDLNGGRAEFV